MIVVGAKGMAKEVLEMVNEKVFLYHDLDTPIQNEIYDNLEVLRDISSARSEFLRDKRFILGIGSPKNRRKMFDLLEDIGGIAQTIVHPTATIGEIKTRIGRGSTIMAGVAITSNVEIGLGVLINLNSSISHDSIIGDFCEIACGVVIPGNCQIGKDVFIGSNATLLPNISIGNGSVIGAGTVVLNDIPADCTVVGNPGRILKIK